VRREIDVRNRSVSKIVQEASSDDFFKRFIFWIPLLLTFLVVFGGGVGVLIEMHWFVELSVLIGSGISSIDKWTSNSMYPDETRTVFIFAWVFSLYYAVVVVRWKPYREMYLKSLVGWRRRARALPGVAMLGFGLFFFNVPFPAEPGCSRLCIYESISLQIFYSSVASMITGYGFALLYWWLACFFKVKSYGEDDL